MRPDELRDLARRSPLPGVPPGYWDRLPGAVVGRLRSGAAAPLAPGWVDFYRWFLVGFPLALAAVAFGFFYRGAHRSFAFETLADGRVLREQLQRYPGRLRALVDDGTGLQPQLIEGTGISTSAPVCVEFRDGATHRLIVTFSGQSVSYHGRTFMVLSDGRQQVMLVSPGFFWSSQAPGLAAGLTIRAAPVRPAAPLL